MSLKEQLKILQSKKEYAAMIALLEASDEPNRSVIIARIQLKMQEAARAEVVLNRTSEPAHLPFEGDAKKSQPVKAKDNPQLRATVILGLISVGVLGALALWFVITYPKTEAQIGVSLYCGIWQDGDNCREYSQQVMAQYEPTVMACYYKHQYPKYDASYYKCLEDAGI